MAEKLFSYLFPFYLLCVIVWLVGSMLVEHCVKSKRSNTEHIEDAHSEGG